MTSTSKRTTEVQAAGSLPAELVLPPDGLIAAAADRLVAEAKATSRC